jgi:tetratricopeptide (TPR) repeat protein
VPPGPEANTPKTTEKPDQKPVAPATVEAPPTVVADPIVTLHDQIEAAATPQERMSLQLKLAELLVANNKKTEAIAELQKASSGSSFDPQGLYNVGNALARLGNTDGAIASYRKAIGQRNGGYSRALNNLGVVLLRVGRWDEAFDALSSALKLENFRYAEASYNLGRLYAARGQTDLAAREWHRAIAVDPGHSAASKALARMGNDERITVEEPATKNRATTTNTASTPAAERSKLPVSRGTSKPLALDPVSLNFLQKARTASERGDKQEAVDNYQRVLSRQSGYFGPASLELSFVLIGLKRNDEALANLLQVTNRDGGRYPISYYHLARIYEVKGQLKLAEDAFAQALAAYGNQNNQFLLDLSRVREKQGNFKGALEAMEQYVALEKKNGQDLVWSEERLTALQQKVAARQPK